MTWLQGLSARNRLALAMLLPIAVLMGLLLLAPPDGTERTPFLQFVGRFHPLSIHLPIALLLLIPLIELAGRSRRFPSLLPAGDFLLGVATLGAIAAAYLGWCLARSEGAAGPLITQHMWGGAFVAASAWACWVLRSRAETSGSRRLYYAALAATVVLVAFTGHRGGQLSQGENYLTEFMPEPLASIFDVGGSGDLVADSTNGGPATFYGANIQPILSDHCTTCHGRNKHKGNLRLNSFDALMRGGKHGAAIKAGDLKTSELCRRIALPSTDDEAMPPDNRRPLSANDIKLIQLWVTSGASGTAPVDAIKNIPAGSGPTVAEVTPEEVDPARVAAQRAGLASAVAQLRQRFPNILDYRSRDSADLVVNAAWMGAKFGDKELAALAPVADRIVDADFSNTSITDQSAKGIAIMKHLRILRLGYTKITDATVRELGALDQLESLSVFGTSVTAASLPAVSHLSKLQRVYVGETKVVADASIATEIRNRLVF